MYFKNPHRHKSSNKLFFQKRSKEIIFERSISINNYLIDNTDKYICKETFEKCSPKPFFANQSAVIQQSLCETNLVEEFL